MKKALSLILALLALTLVFVGCGSEDELIGNWESKGGAKMHLYSDGKATIAGNLSATWEATDTSITFTFTSGETLSYNYKVEGNTLTLSHDRDGNLVFTRK